MFLREFIISILDFLVISPTPARRALSPPEHALNPSLSRASITSMDHLIPDDDVELSAIPLMKGAMADFPFTESMARIMPPIGAISIAPVLARAHTPLR